MSGRGPPEAPKSGRSQNSQNRLPGGFGAGRGTGGRGQSAQAVAGRGNGLPTANQPTYISEEYGMSYPGNMGGGGYHGSDNKTPQQQRTGPVPGRGVILPRGVPAFPQASNIPFGTIIGEDGTINEFPSPQQDRSDPNKGAGRTANAGRGPPRQNGPRNLNKPTVQKGPHSMHAGVGGSPLAFGSNVPSMAMVNTYATMGHAYPPYSYMAPVNSSAFQTAGYQNYPQTAMYGQQMQYQQFAPHQQAYQPPQQYGRGTQHQAYQPPPQQMRQPQQNDPKAPVPKVPAPPVERRSKALSIMDPNTNQPVTLGDRPLAAAGSSSQAGVRKQPSQGAPTPRPGQASSSQNGPVVPQSRQLHITAPPQGGPSKASAQAQPKPATTPAAVVTTPTPQAASMPKPPLAKTAPEAKAQLPDANGDLEASGSTSSQGIPAESPKSEAVATPSTTGHGDAAIADPAEQRTAGKEPSKQQAIEQEAAAAKEAAAKEQAAKEQAAKEQAAEEAAAAEATAAAAEAARKAEEASAKRKAEAEAAAAAAAKKKADEEAAAAAAAKKAEEEAALKRKEEEDKAAAVARRRAEEEEAAQRKASEDATRQKAAEDAAAKQRDAEEAAARQVAEKSAAEQAEREAEEAAVQSASLQVTAAKETAEEAAVTDNGPSAALEEPEASTSSSEPPAALDDTASSASAPAQPKKKGKKALNAAIERRKEKESYDGREVDMSAYKPPAAQQAANGPAASPAPIATPEPKQDAVKAGSEPSGEDEEDWEDKKIETPRGSAEKENHVVSTRKVYSRDFLEAKNRAILATSVHDWPGLQHFDPAAAFLLRGNDLDAGRRGHASMRGPPPHMGGRGDDRWQRKPLPAGPAGFQPPGMAGPPPPPGRGGNGGRGGPPTSRGIEGDRWARGSALPPISSGGRGMTLHRATNRYERGKLISENPEEEKKQKELKSLLNKITPEKYAVIRDKILAVGVNTVLSLKGLIDQVFDKALTEPTFCEIYATLCNDLNQALPEFDPEPDAEDQKRITFRRVLLNKCQEEFEEGAAAIMAVKAREKADADKASGQEEVEEGEISKEDKDSKRRADLLEAEAEQKARRRALGNIQFIGQLYKARMLTEKIMHSCIQTLLEEVANPRREDIECLCKLMSTIGGQLDASPKAASYMTAYFQRMEAIQQIASLEVRHKFMIQDVLDLRMNRWQERRKVEGPKTLEEIHRDARAEQMAPRNRGPPNRGGFREPPPPMRQPMPLRSRHEDRLEDKPRPMQRTPSQEGMFAPGGRGGGGFRPGGSLASRGSRDPSPISSAPPPPAAPSRPEPEPSRLRPQPAAAPAAAPAPAGLAQLSAEEMKKKGAGMLREFMNLRSTKDAVEIITSELVPGQADFALIIEEWFAIAFLERGIDLGALKELIVITSKEPSVPHKAFQDSLTAVLNQVHDVDYPAVLKLMGDVIGSLLASGVLQLEAIGNTILKAGSDDAEEGEDPLLIDSGKAALIVAASLQQFAATAGSETAVAAWRSSRLQLDAFLPSYEREDKAAVSSLVNKFEIQAFA